MICFVHDRGQNSQQKHDTKRPVEFHNHLHILTMQKIRVEENENLSPVCGINVDFS